MSTKPLTFICLCLLLLSPSFAKAQSIKDYYEKAVDAYNTQQYEKAIEIYQVIIKQVPTFAPAYNGIGLSIKEKDEDPDEAIKYFQLAIHADPRFSQAYENIGRMYYAKGDYAKAQSFYEKGLAIDPNLIGALTSLGWIHLLAKANPVKAVKYFKQAYALDNNPNTYFALGMAYFSSNDRIAAIEVVTALREMKQEGLATQLEKAIRENRRVSVDPVTEPKAPDVPQPTARASNPSNQASGAPGDVKVRLRGKLEDI